MNNKLVFLIGCLGVRTAIALLAKYIPIANTNEKFVQNNMRYYQLSIYRIKNKFEQIEQIE